MPLKGFLVQRLGENVRVLTSNVHVNLVDLLLLRHVPDEVVVDAGVFRSLAADGAVGRFNGSLILL